MCDAKQQRKDRTIQAATTIPFDHASANREVTASHSMRHPLQGSNLMHQCTTDRYSFSCNTSTNEIHRPSLGVQSHVDRDEQRQLKCSTTRFHIARGKNAWKSVGRIVFATSRRKRLGRLMQLRCRHPHVVVSQRWATQAEPEKKHQRLSRVRSTKADPPRSNERGNCTDEAEEA